MAKKSKNSKLLVHYTRTMTPENLSRAANYVGGYVLRGLGALGKIFTAPLTGGPLGPATVVLPKTKKLLDAERKLRETQEELIGKAMTWVSPLNYGAALATGHGLNARKGEEEVASWSPAWQAVGRLGELYVGPKAVKGVKSAPRVVVNTAAKAGVKPAKAAVVAREIKLATKNKPNLSNRTISINRENNAVTNSPDVTYTLYNEFGEPIGKTNVGYPLSGNSKSRMVEGVMSKNNGHKVSEDTYNQAVLDILDNGGEGLESGWSLMMPLRTLPVTSKFPHTVIGLQFGNPVRLLTGTTKRPILRVVKGNHYIDSTPQLEWIDWESETPHYKVSMTEEPPTSLKFFERKPAKISGAERAGATKWERNFTPKRHIAYYPGYQLKGLMKGSLLEKQLSKNGTININLLNAYFNKASQLERNVANKVLAEKFSGLKTIDYNLFKKAVLNELISYSRKPQTRYSVYGMDRLGFKIKRETDGAGGLLEYTPGIKTNTFSFESPNIPTGNARHYDSSTLGHSRTYTTPDEPNILHVMESLSDWGQSRFFEDIPRYLTKGLEYTHMNNAFKRLLRRVPLQFKEEYNRLILDFLTYGGEFPDNIRNSYSEEFKDFVEDLLNPYAPYPNGDAIQRWNRMYNYNSNSLYKYLHDNYLQRQLQENLKYAAENGLTKMRYPTSKTASKIEGYLKVALPRSTRAQEIELRDLLDKMWKEYYDANESQLSNASLLELKLIGRKNIPNYAKIMDELELLENIPDKYEYTPEHQTILKKYTDFPKLFLKLYKGLNVRTVTDAKGNTWYEVDVPKGYLSREWLFKQGGKINITKLFKEGGQIRKMLTASGGPIYWLRKRLYNNIEPFGYNDVGSRLINAIVLNKNEHNNFKGDYSDIEKAPALYLTIDNIWGEYLHIPEKERRYSNGKYKIKNNGNGTFSLPFESMEDIMQTVNSNNPLLWGLRGKLGNSVVGEYDVHRGYDKNGDYIKYIDHWRINPYDVKEDKEYGLNNNSLLKWYFKGKDDASFGLGTPVEIQGKYYLDDIYNVKGKDRGGHYLPEIIVTGKKKQGGKMNIVERFKKGRVLNTKKYYDKSILYRLYKGHRES